jgi:hypothetical protein
VCDVMTRVRLGVSSGRMELAQDFEDLAFRFLVAIDVEGFSKLHTAQQATVQSHLERSMAHAAVKAGLDRERWYRQPRGDGELAVLPAGVNGLSLVADYPRKLASAVAAFNQAGRGGPRMRLRLAIHHGAVAPGWFGPVGGATVEISRLVDAETVRQHLRQHPEADVALIVSATVYKEVIQSRLRGLNPEHFRRMAMRAKGVSYVGYLYQDALGSQDRSVPAPRKEPITA